MRFLLSILARFFFVTSVVIFIGGLANSIFDSKMVLRINPNPIELPTDFLGTFFSTFILLVISGIFWFLSDIRSSIKKMKGNIRTTLTLFGCTAIAIILIVTNINFIQGVDLHPYIYNNDLPGLQKVIHEGKVKNRELNNTLDTAIVQNKSALVPVLLDAGAEINLQSRILKTTPLMQAAVFGNLYIIEILLQYGADVNMIEESSGKNAAMMAVFSRNFYNDKEKNEEEVLKIIQLFMEKNLNLKTRDFIFGNNLLEMAVDEEYMKIAEYLKSQSQ